MALAGGGVKINMPAHWVQCWAFLSGRRGKKGKRRGWYEGMIGLGESSWGQGGERFIFMFDM